MAQNTISYKISPEIDMTKARSTIETMRKALEGMNPNSAGYKEIDKLLKQAEGSLNTFEAKSKQTITKMGDVRQLEGAWGKVTTKIAEVGGAFDRLSKKTPEELRKLFPAEIAEDINKATKALNNFKNASKSTATKNKEKEIGRAEERRGQIKGRQKELSTQMGNARKSSTLRQYLDKGTGDVNKGEVAKIQAEVDAYDKLLKKKNELEGKKSVDGLSTKQQNELDKITKSLAESQDKYNKNVKALATVDSYSKLKTEADGLEEELKANDASLKKMSGELKTLQATDASNSLKTLAQSLKEIKGINLDDVDLDNLQPGDVEKIITALDKLETEMGDELRAAAEKGKQGVKGFGDQSKKTAGDLDKIQTEVEQLTQSASEMAGLRSRMIQFFSITNVINLFKRAVREAYQAVKEIDAAMTETAVVTDFSVGDLWDRMPYYTEQADKLHSTITDVVKAETLYYQQGLKSAQVTELSAETLKMAKIAGMDAAEATDRMTAALRGFNMELNEDSAQRVNDVYSKLAAITAADTDEISNAMTKTASIANNANMEFETTAAFLSQIIETTRESAETAGTAMKTVIARFQELKKDPSEIGEVDGETVDANKIETALRSVGVALRDEVTGQFRDLDDVFLELAKKWDSLDTNTQRYIATIAAGSRQQSRFIAMMSNYERTMELVNAANNSAGASQEQFEKTSESLEAKLNKLKTAWQEFTTGIMNSELIKSGVDLLTGILKVVNKLTGGFDSLSGSVMKLGLAFGGLKVGKKLLLQLTAGSALKGGLGRLMYQGSSTEALQGVVNSNKLKSQTLLGSYFGKTAKQTRGNANLKTRWGQFFNESVSIRKTIGQTGGQDAVKQLQIGLQGFNAESLKNVENQKKLRQVLEQNNVTGKEATRVVNQMSNGTFQLSEANVSAIKTNKSMVKGWGKLVLWAAAILAVVGAYAALKAIMNAVDKANYTAEERIDDLTKANERLNDRLSEVNEELDNLAEKKQAYKDLQKETDKLSKGTAEWSQNAAKLNTQFNEILAKYPKLMENQANYTTENGYMEITAEGWNAYNDYLLDSQAQTTKMLAANNYQLADARADAKRNQLGFSTSAITLKEQNNTKTAGWMGGVGGGVAAGLGTAAAMTAAGAAAGSVVPVVGTIVGAVVGLIVGAAVTFAGTEISKWGEDAAVIDSQLQTLADAGFVATGNEETDRATLDLLKEQGLIGEINSKILDEIKDNTDVLNETLNLYRQKSAQQEAMSYQEGMSLATELGYTDGAAELFAMTYQKEKVGTEYLFDDIKKSINLGQADKKVKAKDDETLALLQEYANMMGYTYSASQQAFIDANGRKLDIVGNDILNELAQLKYLKQIEKNTKESFERKYSGIDKDGLDSRARVEKAIATKDAGGLTLNDLNNERRAKAKGYEDVTNVVITDTGKLALKQGWDAIKAQNENPDGPTATRGEPQGGGAPTTAINVDAGLSIARSFGSGLENIEDVKTQIEKKISESPSQTISDVEVYEIVKPYLEKAKKYQDSLDLLSEQHNEYLKKNGFENQREFSRSLASFGLGADVTVADAAKLENKNFSEDQKKLLREAFTLLPSGLKNTEKSALQSLVVDAIDTQDVAQLQDYIGQLRLSGQITEKNKEKYIELVEVTKQLAGEWGFTAEETTKRLKDINSAQEEIEKMRKGEFEEITQEMHDTLVTKFGQELDDFVKTLDGYKFVGSIQDLEDAVRKATIELAKANIVDNEKQQGNKELFDTATKNTVRGEGGDSTAKTTIKRDNTEHEVPVEWLMGEVVAGRATTEDQSALAKYFFDNKSKFTKQQLESLGFKYDEKGNLIDDTNNPAFLTDFTGKIANVYGAKDYDPKASSATNVGIAQQILSTAKASEIENYDWDKNGLEKLTPDEKKQAQMAVIFSKLRDAGLDEQFGDDWTDLYNADAKTQKKALEVAIQFENAEKIDDLVDSLDNNIEVLQNEDKQGTPEYERAKGAVQNSLEGIFAEVDDKAFDTYVFQYLDELAEGGETAKSVWREVGKAMLQSALKTEKGLEVAAAAGDNLNQVLKDVDGVYEAVVNNDVNRANELFASLVMSFGGGQIGLDYAKWILKASGVTVSGGELNNGYTYNTETGKYSNSSGEEVGFSEAVSEFSFQVVKFEGTGLNNGNNGNNGGKTSDKWENPYDIFYNLNKDLEILQRKREKLERQYNKLLEKGNGTIADRLKLINKQESSIKDEMAVNNEIIKTADSEITKLQSRGSKSLGKYYGKNGYAWEENGELKINFDKLEGLENKNADEAKKVEDWIKEYEEVLSKKRIAEDSNNDLEDELEEGAEKIREAYIDAANEVKDAIISAREKEIEELQEINDTINDGNQKLMNSIRENLDKMRQDRENEKTEEELREKENRLAYMKADTSGLYAKEILELEKELKDERQSYTDTLVDQKLEEMEKQNEEASEQRQAQIDLLQSQLDYDKENGKIWTTVAAMMAGSFKDGQFDLNSELGEMLKIQAGYYSMSAAEQKQWEEGILSKMLDYGTGNAKGLKVNETDTTKIDTGYKEEPVQVEQPKVEEPKVEYYPKYTGKSGSITDALKAVGVNSSMGNRAKIAVANGIVSKEKDFKGTSKQNSQLLQLLKAGTLKAYKTGGLNTETGLAWLDGTKANPELVLNAKDTRNFIMLKDILSDVMNGGNIGKSQTIGESNVEINITVEKIDSEIDIDNMANRIKKIIVDDAMYRNVNTLSRLR